MGKNNKSEAEILRQKAEKLLKKKPLESRLQLSEGEMQRLIHELEVHQIELEMQNEELVLAKERVELAAIEKTTDEVSEFAENIINTVREPLLVLDQDLRVVKASRSFYSFFKVTAVETIGKLIYDLGDNQWDIPKLRELLETILPQKTTFDDYEVEHNFSTIGRRVMLLNARQVKRAFGKEKIILLAIEDITERKDKEDSLQETHRATSDSLKILLNHMHAPMIIWDASMKIKRLNRQFELLSGYDSAEVIDKKIDILFPKEKIAASLELLKNHLDDEQEVIEIAILTKDNQIKTVLWNSSHTHDEDGKNIIATISQDITSRKRTEDALNLLETRYRRLFESAKDGILILDAETGKIIDVNPFLMELLGYSKEEMTGKEIWEIGFFKDIAANKEKFAELQQREYVRYDNLPLETASGRKINVEFVSNVYLVSKNKIIQCNIRDVTERKQAELALQNSETHLRTLVQTIPDLIWLKDPDGNYLSCNTRFERFFGAREADIIGKTDYDFVDRDLADFFRENDRKAMAAGKPTSNEEWVTFAEDGHREFLDTIKTPMYDSNEKLIGVLGIGRDNTQRKLAEQKVRASEKRFRAIFDQAPIAIALLDLQGHPIISNSPLSKMLGYSTDELSKMMFTEFTYPEDIDKDIIQFAALIAGKISGYSMEKRYIHKNGNLIWANLFVTTLNDNNGLPQEIIGMVEDITERKKAEEKLINSEEKFKIIFDYAPDAYYLNDLKGTFIDGNIAAFKMLGFNKNELIGKSFFNLKLISGIQLIKASVLLAKNLLGKATGPDEFVLNKKNGSKVTVEIRTYPVKIQDQSIVLGIARDITERKSSETEIAMLAHSLKSISECVSITDPENNIIFVNESFLKTYGYELNELIGKNISIVRSQANEQKSVDRILPATILGKWQGELLNRRKDGSEFPIYLSTTIIKDKDGNPLGLIGVAKDITERKKNEYELKFQADLLSNVGQAVIATDLAGSVIYWNNAAEKLYGWSSAEVIGQNIISIVSAQTSQEQATEIMKNLSEGNSWNGEFLVKRKDGSNFTTMVTNAPFFNSKEELAGIIGISSDITERKLAETELIIAKNKAEESDRLKSSFLANMSHEVRTPLNSIIGFSELLGDPDFEEDQKNEFIQHIVASGNNLLNIISDIMDISKMESGEITIRKKPINAHEYVLGIYEQFSFQAATHKLELILNLPDKDKETEIFADVERLRQIFNNLIGNAFKFTVNGSIEIGYRHKSKMVEFFVKDTGIGIPASYQDKIFDRFRQVEDEKTRKYGGNGLGLAITKNLVNLMGGKIWVESNEGKGSAFYFTMPAQSLT